MANGMYGLTLQNYNFSGIAGVNVKCVLVLTGPGHYVVNLATDAFLSAIVAGDRVATSPNMASVTWTLGVYDAADFSFGVVAAGPAAGALVWYVDTGVAATSNLICYVDSYTGLPVTPDGVGAITVQLPVAGLFQI